MAVLEEVIDSSGVTAVNSGGVTGELVSLRLVTGDTGQSLGMGCCGCTGSVGLLHGNVG